MSTDEPCIIYNRQYDMFSVWDGIQFRVFELKSVALRYFAKVMEEYNKKEILK